MAVRLRCHELATDPAWWNRLSDPFEGMPGRLSPGGVSVRERAALALVIFGHLGYVEAAGELAMSPPEMAALLLAILHRMTAADMASSTPASTPGSAALRAASWRDRVMASQAGFLRVQVRPVR